MIRNILFFIISIFSLSCTPTKPTINAKTDLELKEIRCTRDRAIANEELKRGNIMAYFDNIDKDLFSEYQYYLFKKYNIICRYDYSHYFECQKSIMDSVVFAKYGVNFYSRIKDEIVTFFNNRKDNLTPEGYYYTYGSSHYSGGLDSLYSYIDSKLPDVNVCNIDTTYIRDAEVIIYIDTTGYLKYVELKKRICPKIDHKIIEVFNCLPGKFNIPLVDGNKYPIIEELYLKW